MSVRVRFAPSPTGPLHMGGVRTALYNYLFAKKNKGTFILRIEDTDQQRFVPGAEEYIIESLKWCGIIPNEGVGFGEGEFTPYRQSERKAIYRKYVDTLIEKGHAYYAFDTPEELDAKRNHTENWKYDFNTRNHMKNSLTLVWQEVENLLDTGEPYVIRLKVPENEDVYFVDQIRGEITINTAAIDDKVMFKSDGLPTYHLANVVDDHLMEITHVIRGEEWLPSTPIHVLLYEFFGWDRPQFAHLPLLLKPDGKGKLSKRDGDKLGMPVFPIEWIDSQTNETYMGYREKGFFPEAFVNFIAFLGWNPGTEKEIYSMKELIEDFSIERVHKAGAKFDAEKAKWFNQHYLKTSTDKDLAKLLEKEIKINHPEINTSFDKLVGICALMKERAIFVQDILKDAAYLFHKPTSYDKATFDKKWTDASTKIVGDLKNLFSKVEPADFNKQTLEPMFKNYVESNQLGFGQAMVSLRLVLTGQGGGPGLFETAELLGKDETISRMTKPFMWEK